MIKGKKCAFCGSKITYSGDASDYAYKRTRNKHTNYYCGYKCFQLDDGQPIKVDNTVTTRARMTYGNTNQIAVCVEELSELTKVLAKYFRYDEKTAVEKLGGDALDEVADVYVILEHVKGIFQLSNRSVNQRIEEKLKRMERWLKTSNEFSHTMEDREI